MQTPQDYSGVLADVVGLLESARHQAARSVNAVMTTTYWQIGRRIVDVEQSGQGRAEYGERLIERLSADLTTRFGRGFGRRNLFQMRAFYLAYREKVQTVSALSDGAFPMPWSHVTANTKAPCLIVASQNLRWLFYLLSSLHLDKVSQDN
jgi:hypothetical protein